MNFFSSAKDRKTTALSKKNTVSSVNGSYGIVVILAYLSPQPSLEVCTLPGTFSSTLPFLCCIAPASRSRGHFPTHQTFWLSGWGALMFKTLESHHLSLCFPPVGINEMLLFFLTVFPVKCPKCPISAPHRSVKASCRKIKASKCVWLLFAHGPS